MKRRRNGDRVYESDGTEHDEKDETGDDGEDKDENEEDEDDDADEENEDEEGEDFDDEGEDDRCIQTWRGRDTPRMEPGKERLRR